MAANMIVRRALALSSQSSVRRSTACLSSTTLSRLPSSTSSQSFPSTLSLFSTRTFSSHSIRNQETKEAGPLYDGSKEADATGDFSEPIPTPPSSTQSTSESLPHATNPGPTPIPNSPSHLQSLAKEEAGRSVFVANLKFTTSEDTLKEEFGRHGEVEEVFMPKYPGTPDNKG